jgi:hypothetical protein
LAKDKMANQSTFLDLAGSKLRARLSSGLNESASDGVTSKFARRHLEKLGWEEGTGLGKRRSGITTHIKVKKRNDELGGLGKSSVDEKLQIGNEWWKSSTGSVLAKLGGKKKKKKEKKTFTDEELFEATGGARFGMRAQAPQKGKWKRTENNDSLQEQEEEARQKVEWDGTTAPKVILSSSEGRKKNSKKKKRKLESDEAVGKYNEIQKERRAKKIKKKAEKKKKA